MLTAFGELEDKVQGFDCGADDSSKPNPSYSLTHSTRQQALDALASAKSDNSKAWLLEM